MRRAIVPAVVRVANDVLAGEMTLVEDFAVALVDEIERPARTGRRYTGATN